MQAQAAGHANTEDEERQDEDAVRCSAIVDQPRAAVGMLEEFSSVGLGQAAEPAKMTVPSRVFLCGSIRLSALPRLGRCRNCEQRC